MNGLFHYSPVEDFVLDAREYSQIVGLKPEGLWVSVDAAWDEWCRDNEFRSEYLAHRYAVALTPGARILTLATVEAIDDFTTEYAVSNPRTHFSGYIDWPTLAKEYDGIVISPYQWARRMESHTFWYYGWDCASGCIWNLRAIDSLTDAPVQQGAAS